MTYCWGSNWLQSWGILVKDTALSNTGGCLKSVWQLLSLPDLLPSPWSDMVRFNRKPCTPHPHRGFHNARWSTESKAALLSGILLIENNWISESSCSANIAAILERPRVKPDCYGLWIMFILIECGPGRHVQELFPADGIDCFLDCRCQPQWWPCWLHFVGNRVLSDWLSVNLNCSLLRLKVSSASVQGMPSSLVNV